MLASWWRWKMLVAEPLFWCLFLIFVTFQCIKSFNNILSPRTTELRTHVFAVRLFAPNIANSEQRFFFLNNEQCEQQTGWTVRTVHLFEIVEHGKQCKHCSVVPASGNNGNHAFVSRLLGNTFYSLSDSTIAVSKPIAEKYFDIREYRGWPYSSNGIKVTNKSDGKVVKCDDFKTFIMNRYERKD